MNTVKTIVLFVTISSLLSIFLSTSTSAAGFERVYEGRRSAIEQLLEAERHRRGISASEQSKQAQALREEVFHDHDIDCYRRYRRETNRGMSIGIKDLSKLLKIDLQPLENKIAPFSTKGILSPAAAGASLRVRLDESMDQYELLDIGRAQEFLEKAGFNPGKPAGVVGSKTRHALQEYQKSRQLPENGKLDNETWRSLAWDAIDLQDIKDLYSPFAKLLIPERNIINKLSDEREPRSSSMIVKKGSEEFSLKFNAYGALDSFEKGRVRFNAEMESHISNESTRDISFVYMHDESTVQIANRKAPLQTVVNTVNENLKETKGTHNFVIRSSGNDALDINAFHSLEKLVGSKHRVYMDDNMKLAKENILIQPLIKSMNQIGVLVDPGIGVKDLGIHDFIKDVLSDSLRIIREDQILEVDGILLLFGHKDSEYIQHLRSLAGKGVFKGKSIVSFSCAAPGDKALNSELIQNGKAASVIYYSDIINSEMVKEVLSQMVKEPPTPEGFTLDELITRAVKRSEKEEQNPRMKIELKKLRPITQISRLRYNPLVDRKQC